MGTGGNRRSLAGEALPLLLPLALYGAFVLVTIGPMMEQFNVDAVAYIANARRIVEGRFAGSVSSYWSPLLSWLLAPLLAAGLDPLAACRYLLAGGGGALLCAVYLFARRLPGAGPWSASLAAALSSLVILHYAMTVIAPDVFLAALLFLYFTIAVSPRLLDSRPLQVGAGLAAAFAFLAKAYALPFFVAHWTASMILRRLLGYPSATPRRSFVAAWAAGAAAFAAVALLWIGTLSLHYGRPTFSSVGKIALSFVGPAGGAGHPIHGLKRPPEGEMTVWESPEKTLEYHYWSPLESREDLLREVRYALRSMGGFFAMVGTFDEWGVGRILLVVLPVVLLGRGGFVSFFALWTPLTFLVYLGGFSLVYHGDDRYLVPLLWPLACVYAVVFTAIVAAGPAEGDRSGRWKAALLLALTALSFGLGTARATGRLAGELAPAERERRGTWRDIADSLSQRGLSGPLAVSPGLWATGLAVAFHLDTVFLGDLEEQDAPAALEALDRAGARLLLAAADWPPGQQIARSPEWRLEGALPTRAPAYFVLVRQGGTAE